MRPRVTVLINPHAGSKTLSAPAIARALDAAGADPDVQQADGARLRAHVLDALNGGSRTIIAAGGDGTVSTVASALTGTDVVLGILPLGTLNHFAKDLRIPSELEQAAKTIVAAETVRVDVAEVSGRLF